MDETFLLEVVVGGQGFADAAPAHEEEADRIAERVSFVLTMSEKLDGLTMQVSINPNDFNFRVS